MPLHVRDMLPPVRELIEELEPQIVSSDVEDVYERDEKTGVLVRAGKTTATHVLQWLPTGRMVESFETVGEGDEVITHEGSMKQVDLHCGDCGSLLKPANDRDFYYLLCSRLNERNHAQFERIEQRRDDDGNTVSVLVTWDVESDEPKPDCVLECDNEPREWAASVLR